MNFCIDFYGDRTMELLKTADEINILLEKIKDLTDLPEFCEIHKNQRINLCVNDYDEDGINQLLYFAFDFQQEKKGIYDIVVRLPYFEKKIFEKIKEKYSEARFYFQIGCTTWDALLGFLNLKVTDVFIVEGMGFELDKIAPIVHESGAKIRVFPNIAQSSWSDTLDLQKFWIRPEDTEKYEEYIDIYEFIYEEYDQQKVYYDIYFKDKKWFGDLNEIIIGLKEPINSSCLLPSFAERRIKCGRQCLKGGKCQMCQVIYKLSKVLKEKDLLIQFKKEKEEEKDGERSNSESGSSEENIG